jgi:hypothetical protein
MDQNKVTKVCSKGDPVTGDYDLWMVAPHIESTLLKGKSDEEKLDFIGKFEEKPIRGGTSTLSPMLFNMLYGKDPDINLNTFIGRPVGKETFHHGAEMQNLFFLQELDQRVGLFVPEDMGMAFQVDGQVVPILSGSLTSANYGKVLAALTKYGFFVTTNPLMMADVFNDPHFSGQGNTAGVLGFWGFQKDIKNYRASRQLIRDFVASLRGERGDINFQTHFDLDVASLADACVVPEGKKWVLPTVCKDSKCGAAPETTTLCKTQSIGVGEAHEWQKVTIGLAGGFVVDTCVEAAAPTYRYYQRCNRIESTKLASLAKNDFLMDEKKYSYFVKLILMLEAEAAAVLSRVYFKENDVINANEYRTKLVKEVNLALGNIRARDTFNGAAAAIKDPSATRFRSLSKHQTAAPTPTELLSVLWADQKAYDAALKHMKDTNWAVCTAAAETAASTMSASDQKTPQYDIKLIGMMPSLGDADFTRPNVVLPKKDDKEVPAEGCSIAIQKKILEVELIASESAAQKVKNHQDMVKVFAAILSGDYSTLK